MEDDLEKLAEYLDFEDIQRRLIMSSLYLFGFNILKASIIDRIKNFFISDLNRYNEEVLNLSKSRIYASLFWLQKHSVINNEDLNLFNEIKEYRNYLAHSMMDFLDGKSNIEIEEVNLKFEDMIKLLNKIEIWWIMEFEIPINPDFDNEILSEKDVSPGPVILLKVIKKIAFNVFKGKFSLN